MKRQTKQEKAADVRIDKAFNARCKNIQIGIMDIPKIFAVGRGFIAATPEISDDELGEKVLAYVTTISK